MAGDGTEDSHAAYKRDERDRMDLKRGKVELCVADLAKARTTLAAAEAELNGMREDVRRLQKELEGYLR